MGTAMLGAEAAKAMKERLKDEAQDLKKKGVSPCLAIVRAGAREDDLSYERGAKKRMEMIGIETRSIELPADITQELLEEENECSVYADTLYVTYMYFQSLHTELRDLIGAAYAAQA